MQARSTRHLQVLAARLLRPEGWSGAEALARGEALWTGRASEYAASTVRKRARALAIRGAADAANVQVREQVHSACAETKGPVRAYTDLFDQVYWSKKPSHSGPIGRLGNRLLAATYVGMTFVQAGTGPALGYALSWHKPAAPLQDPLSALYEQDAKRAEWLLKHVQVHIWDRGGCGQRTLVWALGLGIPYLTLGRSSVQWTDYEDPQWYTANRVPVFVRPDESLANIRSKQVPRVVIFPASAKAGLSSTRAIVYRLGADLGSVELSDVEGLYKTRWPFNENAIKGLLTVGWGLNRERRLVLTTSRGTEGARERHKAERIVITAELRALNGRKDSASRKKGKTRRKRLVRIEMEEKKLDAKPLLGARPESATELLCKWIQLWLVNELMLTLWRSDVPVLQALGLVQLRRLLLERPAWVVLDSEHFTVCVDPMRSAKDVTLQRQLVAAFDKLGLRLADRALRFRLKPPRSSAFSQC